MESLVLQRIKSIIDYYRISEREFSKSIGVAQTTINSLFKRGNDPNTALVCAISNAYADISVEWLITGKGEMVKGYKTDYENSSSCLAEPTEEYRSRQLFSSIPLVKDDIMATCGVPDGFSVAIRRENCENIVLPGIKGDFAIRAKGRSMINHRIPERSILEGNIIVCNRWSSRSHVRWGDVYALATPDGIVIKQLQPSDREGCVTCVSFNEEENFLPYDLPVSEILDWAIVVSVVNITGW